MKSVMLTKKCTKCGLTKDRAVFPVRVLYTPGHGGNNYTFMDKNQMRDIFVEAIHWGFNGYADWFDSRDHSDPFVPNSKDDFSVTQWKLMKANFRTAHALGLKCELVLTPNQVYVDQDRPELAAAEKGRIFGQLLCPSKPQARAIILRNHENIFAGLAKAGVKLSALHPFLYDNGGCACEKCRPWVLTWAKLCREIDAIARRYHPGIETHMVGWWWTDEEHKLLKDWADREAPGWVKSFSLHIPYGGTDVSNVPLPKGCERRAFVHISFAEDEPFHPDSSGDENAKKRPRDTYGWLGPVIAATRLERTVANLRAHGCTGVVAYSEGIFGDVNKALLAGLTSGKYNCADEVLFAYAERYFGADPDTSLQWVNWLRPWGWPFNVNAQEASEILKKFQKDASHGTWQLRQWQCKAELLRLNAVIMRDTDWSPERLAKVEQFWAVKEQRMEHDLWGYPEPEDHRHRTPVPWYKSWDRYVSDK